MVVIRSLLPIVAQQLLRSRDFILIYPIGVQKGGSQYSPAIVVYTLHSIIMVLLYYIYLLGTYHWLLSLILSVHFRNWMHLNINY